MTRVMLAAAMIAAGMFANTASAQAPAPAAPATGPAFSKRYFTTLLEKDPSRDVQMQMQLHLPNRPGNGFHTHNGDQWQVVIEGEITYMVRGQEPKVLKTGEFGLHPARHHPSQREQERRADTHHRAPGQGQGQAAEQSGAGVGGGEVEVIVGNVSVDRWTSPWRERYVGANIKQS